MPYSISALFALPQLRRPSPPVVKYTPTRTTPIFLEPTRCLPSPTSSEPSELPYVVMYGLAALLFASVVFTIWSTFKDARRAPTPTAAVPPEPVTEPDIAPQNRVRLLSFFFALFMTILAYASTTKTPASNSLFPQLMLYRLALVLENRVLDILSLIQHIYDYGLYYLKTAFLAVVGHFAGLLIVLAQRRAVAFISRHRVRLDKAQYLEIFSGSCLTLGPWLLWALHPKLRRILWMYYYFYCRDGYTPSIEDIRRRVVMASPTFSWETISIVTGPLVIYSSWACLRTVYLALLHLPSTIWAIVRSFRPGGLPIFVAIVSLWTWIATVIFRFLADISFTSSELKPLGRGIRRWFHDLEDLASSSPEAREQLAQFRRFYKERHNNWRIMQKKEFHELVRLLWESMWVRAHWSQKLLIAAPVIIIYSYFYIMPVVRNVIPRVQYWRWRRRRMKAIMSSLPAALG
ncbi:hypothetical protein FB45DRAFT_1149436 [Roridomyces roridus]|uniref:Uncharacterized protein n=1 Tax=Roridomyces roridus TaxID=1738132 RepID=A0AAD7AZD7_9AGAR|nr:hypothetical protein FB45DRAFT_1149436 [Roridomyces roridus]